MAQVEVSARFHLALKLVPGIIMSSSTLLLSFVIQSQQYPATNLDLLLTLFFSSIVFLNSSGSSNILKSYLILNPSKFAVSFICKTSSSQDI